MRVINARNVSEALVKGLYHLREDGIGVDSRNGPVVKAPRPVSTVTEKPEERVLFYDWRDANPFFHFYESLWMLAGRQDIAPLTRYVSRMADYSDDGITQNAAYGHRWRNAQLPQTSGLFIGSRDQLNDIIQELRANPSSRQCVLQIWDHSLDLATKTKDHACNIAATFQLDQYRYLEMVVFCRSNNAIWGCHGANAVHFSVLQEYVARACEVPVGAMTQVSVNYHAYDSVYQKTYDGMIAGPDYGSEPYRIGEVKPYPLMQVPRVEWDRDVAEFVTHDGKLPTLARDEFADPFFQNVAWPIVRAHDIYKNHRDVGVAIASLNDCMASDWRRACIEWLERRRKV